MVPPKQWTTSVTGRPTKRSVSVDIKGVTFNVKSRVTVFVTCVNILEDPGNVSDVLGILPLFGVFASGNLALLFHWISWQNSEVNVFDVSLIYVESGAGESGSEVACISFARVDCLGKSQGSLGRTRKNARLPLEIEESDRLWQRSRTVVEKAMISSVNVHKNKTIRGKQRRAAK